DDRSANLRTTYAYSNGVLTGLTEGDSSVDSDYGRSTLSLAVLLGLSSAVAAPLLTSRIDPLGRVTRKQLVCGSGSAEWCSPCGKSVPARTVHGLPPGAGRARPAFPASSRTLATSTSWAFGSKRPTPPAYRPRVS